MMKIRGLAFALGCTFAGASQASTLLYGLERDGSFNRLMTINTSTGAATPLFSFSVASNVRTINLAYNPNTNKFLTVGSIDQFSSQLIEIDPVAQTASVVTHQVPGSFLEGVEYSPTLGGIVLSYGVSNNFTSGRLALLNDNYQLLQNQPTTGMADMDTLFLDPNGALNSMDSNNPTGGFQRNRLNTPFGVLNRVGVGVNMYIATDVDAVWKADEGKMFLNRGSTLSLINPASTALTTVGSYGTSPNVMVGLAVAPVPEPATLAALGLGVAALLRRRKSA